MRASIQGLAQAAAADGEGEDRPKDVRDLAERDAELLVELSAQGEGRRADMDTAPSASLVCKGWRPRTDL